MGTIEYYFRQVSKIIGQKIFDKFISPIVNPLEKKE
jgi:hypothetical protein